MNTSADGVVVLGKVNVTGKKAFAKSVWRKVPSNMATGKTKKLMRQFLMDVKKPVPEESELNKLQEVLDGNGLHRPVQLGNLSDADLEGLEGLMGWVAALWIS